MRTGYWIGAAAALGVALLIQWGVTARRQALAEQEIAGLRDEVARLKAQSEERQAKLESASRQVIELRLSLAEAHASAAAAREAQEAREKEAAGRLDAAAREAAGLQRSLEQAAAALTEARAGREAIEKDLQAAREEAARLGADIEKLDRITLQQAQELEKLKSALKIFAKQGLPVDPIVPARNAAAPAPALSGKVLSTDDAAPVVVVGLGHADGVKEGQRFAFYREGTLIGHGTADKIERVWTIVRVDDPAGRGPVKKGDEVKAAEAAEPEPPAANVAPRSMKHRPGRGEGADPLPASVTPLSPSQK